MFSLPTYFPEPKLLEESEDELNIMKYQSIHTSIWSQYKRRGLGVLGHTTYFHFTQFTVYNGVTHDPENPSVVE